MLKTQFLKKTINLNVVLSFYLFTAFSVKGQVSSVQFKHITTFEGLSQSSVVAINQDQNGIMWFGTRDGLNKYDGSNFTVFRNNINDKNSISNNDILDILEDSDQDMWIATYNGLNLYDSKSMKFIRYQHIPGDPNSLSSSAVRSIVQMGNGKIAVGTVNGLNLVDKFTNRVTRVASPKNLIGSNIYKLYKDKKGRVWIGTERGIKRIRDVSENGNCDFVRYDFEGQVQTITEDDHGNIWFGTKKQGLFRIGIDNKITPYQHFAKGEIINHDVRALTTDHDGNLWVGTYEGVSKIDEAGNIQNFQHDPLNTGSISKNTIKSIFKDNVGSVWIGAYYGGINVWNNANSNFGNLKELANGQGLSYNVVSSIVEDENNLYFGTEGGGVSVLNKQTNLFSDLSFRHSFLPSSNIKVLHIDTLENELWVGTFNAGVFVWSLDRKKIEFVLNQRSGLSSNSIYGIQPFTDDYFCIGTFGGGLNLYDIRNKKVTLLRHEPNDDSSLCDDQVRTILVDSKKNLWIGTQDGLSFLTYEQFVDGDYEMKNYFHNPQSKSGEDVLVVFEDSRGIIWAGTKESGLHFFTEDHFQHIGLFENYENTSNTIHSVLEDDSGILWISSNNGIAKYNHVTQEVRLFEESDGLVSNEYNNNSSLKAASGMFYFGGPDGVSSFRPSDIIESEYTPEVVLTDLKVYNERIYPGDSSEVLSEDISLSESIELDYDQSIFTLQFALPSYINPAKNSYAYRLIGLDSKWKYTKVNEASFTIQEPGKYMFEVKGSNSDGIWNENASELTIIVRPAPWRTWWAFLLYGLSVSLALYFLVRMLKSRDNLKHNLKLEHKANEQQQALNKMKLQFFTNISHEFRTPLTLILGPLQQFIGEYRGSNRLFKQLLVIQQNANQLLKLINQLMEFRKLENKQAELKAAEGNIVKFTKEIFLSFQPFAQSEGYEYTFKSEKQEIFIYYDRDQMERVMYNLISNAFKYTKERKKIEVEVVQKKGKVEITFSDSGIGIKPDSIVHIFDRFYQVNQADGLSVQETSKGTGIGLALTKGIIDLHRGDIDVSSDFGKGSIFKVTLLSGKEHLTDSQIVENFRDSEDVSLYGQHMSVQSSPIFTEPTKNETSLERKKVLVVEDNEQVRQFIISLLDANSYEVSEARNGKEGFEHVSKAPPDLIISDVMMPEMDGIELCTKIKSNLNTSHVPVILLTARTSLIFKYEGLESGADDYINKPFNIKELQLKVKNLLDVMDTLKAKFKSDDILRPSDVTITSIDEELLKKAISVVDENIGNSFFDVPLFCSELGVSRTMLFTKTKAWTNMTPNNFIQSMRMKRAAQLLEQGKINVSQICFSVGYKNPKYFSKAFQKHHLMTPTAYAKKFRAGGDDT